MASGEVATREPAELPRGSVVTTSGRISGVTEPGELSLSYPFPVKDLVRLDDALKFGSRRAKARFAVFIGDLGADTAATAREVLAKVPTPNNAGCEGRRGVLQLRQPDGRAHQRDQGDERRRLTGLTLFPANVPYRSSFRWIFDW